MGRAYEFVADTADGAFAVDRRQTIVMWNHAAAAVTGLRAEDVIGRKCFTVLRGRDSSGCAVCKSGCSVFSAAQRHEPFPAFEMATSTAGGDELWLNVSTLVIRTRRNELSVLVHLFREVTERHELDRVVREFAAIVSDLAPAPPATHNADNDHNGVTLELTQREREILARLTRGESTETMAEHLFISARTVRNHVASILAKLGVHSRLEAVAHATRNGMLLLCGCVIEALG